MQDFTGVPAVVDLAAMRDAMKKLGGDPKKINPLVPVDLVIDHSVIVNFAGNNGAFKKNVEEEYKQNQERYEFLKWAQRSFEDFRVVPPGTGICHQVNLEYLAQTVWTRKDKLKIDGKPVPDGARLSGHAGRHRFAHHHGQRPRGAGLGRRRHRGGGRHAGPALFDGAARGDRRQAHRQAQGRRHRDRPRAHRHADAAQARRGGKFVEFFGAGLANLSIADRATIGNMSPEYGATCGFFPVDDDTLQYLRDTGRAARSHRAGGGLCQGAGHVPHQDHARSRSSPTCSSSNCRRSSPRSPDPSARRTAIALKDVKQGFATSLDKEFGKGAEIGKRLPVAGRNHDLGHGDVVIAAITSCTNTSNPERHDGRRAAGPQSRRQGLDRQAVGQDLAGARLAGGRRISRQVRIADRPRQARLQPGGVRLHHLHRQFGSAGARDLQDHQRSRIW